jgi:creatinine amidohydrolase
VPRSLASEIPWRAYVDAFRRGEPAILVVGALEQHGPHLPMGTDTMIAEAIAAFVAEQLPGVMLPPLPYGAPSRPRSGGGERFPVPALDLATLISVVGALVRGTVASGARKLLVVSWHWENAFVLWDALAGPVSELGVRHVLVDSPADLLSEPLRAELFPGGFPGWESDHAGRLETAIMLHLAPSQTTSYKAGGFGTKRYDVFPTPATAVPADGVFTDPAGVSAGLGRRCLEDIAAALLAIARAELKE